MKRGYLRLRRRAAGLLGIVFLISGILKLWDPVGTMLIVTEYLKFLHILWLAPAAKGLGIALSVTECAVGIGLITGVLRKASAIMAFVMLGGFSLLTLALWIFDAPMDCGCFGEAIHLTHAQSFLKNVALLLVAVLAFVPFREFGHARGSKAVSASVAMLAIVAAVVYSNTHLPIVDFTPFNWGSRLFASLDDEAEEEEFRKAPILSFYNTDGEYLDDMAATGKVVIFSVYDPSKADWALLEENYRTASLSDALPMVLVAGRAEEVQLPMDIEPYFADYKTLITLNRSNGGGSYFYDGELMHKWGARQCPDTLVEDLDGDPDALSTRHVTRRRVTAQGFCVALAAILMLL